MLGPIVDRLPEPVLLVDTSATVLDANRAARGLLGWPVDDTLAASLKQLASDEPVDLCSFLALCSTSREMLPGSVALTLDGERTEFRCLGSRLELDDDGRRPVVVLRLTPHDRASMRFRLLTDRVDELGRQVELRMRAEALLDAQRRILEQIAESQPLPATLETLTRLIETYSSNGALASILLLDDKTRTLRHGAAPSLPDDYCAAIDGIEIGPTVGSCGSAAFLNEPVFVTDITTDSRWERYRDLAAAAGLRACLSTPICGRNNKVLGTFAIYYDHPQEADNDDVGLLAHLARTAGIALERAQSAAEISRLLECERQARADAEDANRAKDEFLAMMSHELRNPLNAIVGWAALIDTEGVDAATLAEGIDAIRRNSALQAKLIDEILDYARIRAGKLRLETEPTDLAQLLRTTVDSARPAAADASIELSLRIETDTPVIVEIDPRRMQQVVGNLLSNAVKFTPEGGSIAVSLTPAEDGVCIAVADTGCGIEPSFLPYVFERFRQQDGSKQRRHDGLGIGLAIVHNVVGLHGGRVVALSEGRDRGATFEMYLPRKGSAVRVPSARRTGVPDLAGVRILVADDMTDARALIKTIFATTGGQVQVAATGAEALEYLGNDRPDVFLCDIGMPGMDGYEVIRRLRDLERDNDLPRLPAVAITAYASDKDRRQALSSGFDAHMAKPVEPTQLRWLVADLAGSV